MPDDFHYESASPPLDRPRSSAALAAVLVVFLLLLAGGAATYYFLRRVPPAPPVPAPEAAVPGAPAAAPVAPPAARVDLPPLEQSDAFVREQLAAVGGAEWRSWLDSDGLARRFAAAVYALAEGKSPRRAVERPFLAGRFAVTAAGGRTRIDPASHARYDRIAETFAAVDAAQAGAAYRLLHPLLDEAWAEIGTPGETLDAAVLRAIDLLLAAPEPPAEAAVFLHEGLYRYEDPALEALPPAQKHLLRMGPENAAKVKDGLRRLRGALR
jgi:hypothetical protein